MTDDGDRRTGDQSTADVTLPGFAEFIKFDIDRPDHPTPAWPCLECDGTGDGPRRACWFCGGRRDRAVTLRRKPISEWRRAVLQLGNANEAPREPSAPKRIAIPSRGRPTAIQAKTLSTLDRMGVKSNAIDVWVASEQERLEYIAAGVRCSVLVGQPGIRQVRNCMTSHYRAGARIVYMDDDIEDIIRRVTDKLSVSVESFDDEVAGPAWDACSSTGAILWGVYPVPNPFFMKPGISTDMRFCCGALHGVVNDPVLMMVELDEKEDFERTVKAFQAKGSVVRLNSIAYKQKPYRNEGGCQADEGRAARSATAARELVRRWPQYFTNAEPRNGHAQVRMRIVR